MGIAHPSIKSLAAAALAGCALAAFSACHKEKPAPPIDQLTEALQHTADQAITAPSLANEQIILSASNGQIDTQAARVLSIASAVGGAGIRSLNAQGQTSILATIPVNNTDAFKTAIQHEDVLVNPQKPANDTTLIEVLITKPAASPTP
jgi:hypothetical protein